MLRATMQSTMPGSAARSSQVLGHRRDRGQRARTFPTSKFATCETRIASMIRSSHSEAWPDLPYKAWKETCATLHLYTQIVGKIRLLCTPWLNHYSHVPFYLTARGLTTSPIPHGDRSFEIAFDFNM